MKTIKILFRGLLPLVALIAMSGSASALSCVLAPSINSGGENVQIQVDNSTYPAYLTITGFTGRVTIRHTVQGAGETYGTYTVSGGIIPFPLYSSSIRILIEGLSSSGATVFQRGYNLSWR